MNIKNIRTQPYNELPDLPPPLEVVDTPRIRKAWGHALEELAELRATYRQIKNEEILFQAISMQEARSSSEIENIYTTDNDLYGDPEKEDPNAKEVKNYQRALACGYEHIKSGGFLTTDLFVKIGSIIVDDGQICELRDIGDTYIANEIRGVKEKIYTPPHGRRVILDKLTNLEKFIYSEDGYGENDERESIEPLIKMAILHYQFEAIHPFRDGNGRTGRILNVLYFVKAGLLNMPTLYLSRYITIHKNDYYDALRKVTEKGEWEAWILFMMNCVREMAKYTREKADEIYGAMQEVQQEIEDKLPKVKNPSKLTELIFSTKYSTQSSFVDGGVGTRKTAGDYLNKLEGVGILELIKQGKQKSYKNVKFMKILTAK